MVQEIGQIDLGIEASLRNVKSLDDIDPRLVAMKLISEGIGEYFDRGPRRHRQYYHEEYRWPRSIQGFFREEELYYSAGYEVVEPIIHKLGKLGIAYLIFNLPTESELKNLGVYQDRVLNEFGLLSQRQINQKELEEYNKREQQRQEERRKHPIKLQNASCIMGMCSLRTE